MFLSIQILLILSITVCLYKNGERALQEGVKRGNLETVKLLLEKGASTGAVRDVSNRIWIVC